MAEYWEHSKITGFNFNDNEANVTQLCGVSLRGTALLSKQINEGLAGITINLPSDPSDDILSFNDDRSLKPELDVMFSKKSLVAILDTSSFLATNKGAKNECENQHEPQERIFLASAQTTVLNAFLGRPFSFEHLKSFKDKEALLSAAVDLGDGDVIINVVLFLAATLKKPLFHRILRNSYVAVQHYVSYLSIRMKIEEVEDIFMMLGRNKDAAMKHFYFLSQNPRRRLDRLQNCSKNHFDSSEDKSFVNNYVNLLKWQETYQGGKLMGESVGTTLSALCADNWHEPKSSHLSPHYFNQTHGISNRLYDWLVFITRGRKECWQDVTNLFITKGWLGGPTLSTELPIENLVNQLHKMNAPQQTLSLFIALMDTPEKRIEVASKFKLHRVVLDNYLTTKNRLGLVSYKAHLNPQSDDYYYAEQLLRNPNSKWKN